MDKFQKVIVQRTLLTPAKNPKQIFWVANFIILTYILWYFGDISSLWKILPKKYLYVCA